MTKVVVAMSGGVDSSVAAALLKEQGYDVIGMMLRLWSEPGKEDSNRCCTPDAMAQARRVAAKLDIPFYVVDAKDVFHNTVVQYFLEVMRVARRRIRAWFAIAKSAGHSCWITPSRSAQIPWQRVIMSDCGIQKAGCNYCGQWIEIKINPMFCMCS